MNPISTNPKTKLHSIRKSTKLARPIIASKLKTAGIIGGLGPQSTSLFYEAFTQYCLDCELPAYPRLIINSVNAWEVIEILKEKDMNQLFVFLKEEIEMIQDRVDFIVMVCNSVHAVIEPLRAFSKVPILSISEEVCRGIDYSTIKKVGVLGTKTTVDNNFYQRELAKSNIDYAVLPEEQEIAFDQFIFEEMLHGRGAGTMKKLLLEGIDNLKEQGCDGIIMACTELPLFINQSDTEIPLFMSTQVLAHAVVDECYRSVGKIRTLYVQADSSVA